jgi:hypothetical protein
VVSNLPDNVGALVHFKVGVIRQFIDTFTCWAASREEAAQIVESGKAKHTGAEEQVTMGMITAAVPPGVMPKQLNFTQAMRQMAQQQQAAQKQIVVPQIVPPTNIEV